MTLVAPNKARMIARMLSGAAIAALCTSAAISQTAPEASAATPPPAAAPAPAQSATPPAPDAAGMGDIVVTARRRAESIQKVPVSVTAVTPAMIQQRGIETTTDLQKLVPGVVFTGAGSNANTTFSIRGQGKNVIGAGLPSVISYFNEVPLPAWGAVLPTFDVANIQVLKGPQGTLFGRNTTGGAVLVYSQAPTYEFGGYGQMTVGAYNWHAFQGAVNVPIIQDKLAVRVAADLGQRDGFTKNLSGFKDSDDLNYRAYRVSLLFQPTDGIKNTTVFDDFWSHTHYVGTIPLGATSTPLYDFGVGAFGAAAGPLIEAGFNCTTSINCNVDQQLARQKATGPRTTYSDVQPLDHTRIWGVSNTTEIDLGPVTFKNIFGYRQDKIFQVSNTDGLPVALINTDTYRNEKQVSDEVQFSGKALDNKFTYLFGGFYLNDRPNGPMGLSTDLFRPAFISPDTPFIGSLSNNLYTDQSKALFASGTYEILPGLKINGGFRHTWDKEGVCADVVQPITVAPEKSLAACRTSATSFDTQVKYQANTWSAGLDYQATRDIFVYGVVRRGYRSGGINTPLLGGTFTPYQFYGPQTVTDGEIGVKTNWRYGDVRGRFNVAVFRGYYKNLQRPITAIPPNTDGDNNPLTDPSNTTLVINSGKARVQGAEVEGEIDPTRNLSFNFGAAYLDPKYTNLSTPAVFSSLAGSAPTFDNSPKWSYSLSSRWTLPFEVSGAKFAIAGDWYWVDDYLVGQLRVPSYGVANASFEISHIGNTPLTLTVFVNNLTNKLYLRNPSLSGTSPGVFTSSYGDPRMYGVRARFTF